MTIFGCMQLGDLIASVVIIIGMTLAIMFADWREIERKVDDWRDSLD